MNAAHYAYVENVNGNLICCICRTPFINPVVTTTCSHTFCNDCISSALVVNPQCPVDRSPLDLANLVPAAAIVRNLVDELIVECPHAPAGCGLACQRQLLASHLASDCQYVQVECSQEGCTYSVLRKDLGKHSQGCPHRLVQCEACGRDVRLSEMETHYDECPATEVTCIHCDAILARASLASHHAECLFIPVPCVHSQYGCPWVGPRHTLPDSHLASCPYEAIKGFFAIQSTRQKELEAENAELKRTVGDLERSVRSHQRDLERAKVRLGSWFKSAPIDNEDAGSVGSQSSSDTPGGHVPPPPGLLRRRLSVPFNPAVFGVEDTASEATARRSTISTTTAPDLDDPYASFTTPHPILSASTPPTYLRSSLVAPLNMSGSLEGTLSSLRSSIVALSSSMDSLERKQDITLTTETLRMHEDVASLRAIVHGLRMQVHNIMMDRNSYFNNASRTSLPSHARTGSGGSPVPGASHVVTRQTSSSNLASISPSFAASGGTPAYTVAQFPHSHHRNMTSGSSESERHDDDFMMGGNLDPMAMSSAARYFSQRAPMPLGLNALHSVTTTVRRGPEGKL